MIFFSGKEENLVSAESCIIAMEVSEALSQSLKTGNIVKMWKTNDIKGIKDIEAISDVFVNIPLYLHPLSILYFFKSIS